MKVKLPVGLVWTSLERSGGGKYVGRGKDMRGFGERCVEVKRALEMSEV